MTYDLKEPNEEIANGIVDKIYRCKLQIEKDIFKESDGNDGCKSNFQRHNDILIELFEKHNENVDVDKVLIKVAVLNTFYSAGVKNIHVTNVAKHIVDVYKQTKYNPCLIASDPFKPSDNCLELVNKLAKVKVKESNEKSDGKVEYYSFASKFCFFQNNKFFSIYDSFVEEALFEFKNKFITKYQEKFGKEFIDFKRIELRNYKTFYIAINQFIILFKLQNLSRRNIDIFLWSTGKNILYQKKEKIIKLMFYCLVFKII